MLQSDSPHASFRLSPLHRRNREEVDSVLQTHHENKDFRLKVDATTNQPPKTPILNLRNTLKRVESEMRGSIVAVTDQTTESPPSMPEIESFSFKGGTTV